MTKNPRVRTPRSKAGAKAGSLTGWIVVAMAVVAIGGGAWLFFGDDAGGEVDARNAELVALGKSVYARACASCHGANLEGEGEWRARKPDGSLRAPPHDATGHTWHHPDETLFGITKFGGQATAPPGFKSNMPAFKDQLSDREIWAVLSYITSRWPEHIRQRREVMKKNQRGSR